MRAVHKDKESMYSFDLAKGNIFLLKRELSTQNRVTEDVPTIRQSKKVQKFLGKFVTKIIVEH